MQNDNSENWEVSRNRRDRLEMLWFIVPAGIWFLMAALLEPTELPYWKTLWGIGFALVVIPLSLAFFLRSYRRKDEYEKVASLKAMATGFVVMSSLSLLFGVLGLLKLANRRPDPAVGWSDGLTKTMDVVVSGSGFLIYVLGMITCILFGLRNQSAK